MILEKYMSNTIIKLDKADRRILFELDKNCRIPTTQLAKKVRKSRQAVEYRIQQLVAKGVITGFNTAFNPHAMGYKLYKIYLKLRNVPEKRQALVNFFRSSRQVYWFGEFSGKWDIICGIFAKDDYEFFAIKNKIISDYNDIIVERSGDIYIDVKQYPKMYFTNTIAKPVVFGGPLTNPPLDELDYEVLGVIVNNGRIGVNELAKRVKSTPSIVRSKVKKLEKNGVIIQYRLSIDLNKLGLELYKAVIKLDRYTKSDEAKLLEYFSQMPNTHYYIRNMWQLEPEIVVPSYQEYYNIIEDVKKTFAYVIRTIDSLLMISDEWTPAFGNILKDEIESKK